MARVLPNWLAGYREYTKESESPDSYHLWAGLSVLASAIRRNIWFNQGIYPLFPNMFVILVGPAGKVAKSTTIRLARDILRGVEGITIGPDSVTREELIRSLAKSEEGGVCAMTLHSTELSSLIEPSGLSMIQFLTDIYDCDYKNPDGWRYGTKTQGKDIVKDPVINILAGTTPSWIADEMPTNVVEHGLTARTVFVYEDDTRFSNPWPQEPDKDVAAALRHDLRIIADLNGVFGKTAKATRAYEEIYEQIRQTEPEDHRVAGFHWRKRTHILKVAMLLRIAEGSIETEADMLLHEQDILAAHQLVEDVGINMAKTFSAVGKYEHAGDLERIYAQIKRAGGMDAAELYNKNYFVAEPDKLTGLIKMLIMMGRIKLDSSNGRQRFLLTGKS